MISELQDNKVALEFMLQFIVDNGSTLSVDESNFINNITTTIETEGVLTDPQFKWFNKIYDRLLNNHVQKLEI